MQYFWWKAVSSAKQKELLEMYEFYKSLHEKVIDREWKANQVVRWSAVLLFLTAKSWTYLDDWTKNGKLNSAQTNVKKCTWGKPDLAIV